MDLHLLRDHGERRAHASVSQVSAKGSVPVSGLYAFDLRSQIAIADLSAAVVEAALDQPAPSPMLASALQTYLSYVRHRDRDRSRDGLRPAAKRAHEDAEDA